MFVATRRAVNACGIYGRGSKRLFGVRSSILPRPKRIERIDFFLFLS